MLQERFKGVLFVCQKSLKKGGNMKNLKLNYEMSISDVVDMNDDFARAKCCIAYVGDNQNKSSISKEAFENALPTIKNIPIVGRFDVDEQRFGSHDLNIVKDSKGIRIINATIPYGVIPESANQWFEKVKVGEEEKECLYTDALIWKRQYGYEHLAEVGKVDQSMEILPKSITTRDDGIMQIDSFSFQALCMLESADPCYENANVELYAKKENSKIDDFNVQMSEMMEELKKYELNGGNQKLKEKLELLKKFNIKKEDLNFSIDELSLEDLEAKLKEFEADDAAAEADTTTEEVVPAEDDDPTVEEINEPTPQEEVAADKENADEESKGEEFTKKTFSSTYREKMARLTELLPSSCEYDEENEKCISGVYSYLMDCDDEYVYVEEEDYDGESYTYKDYKQAYTYDKANDAYALTGEQINIQKVWVTDDELQKLRENFELLKKEFETYKGNYSAEEFEELKKFKLEKISKEKEEAMSKLFEHFKGSIGEMKEYKELFSKREDFEVADLKKELTYLFGLHAMERNEETEDSLKFSVNTEEEKCEDYGGLLDGFTKIED